MQVTGGLMTLTTVGVTTAEVMTNDLGIRDIIGTPGVLAIGALIFYGGQRVVDTMNEIDAGQQG